MDSPEYYPYEPGWGRLSPELRKAVNEFLNSVTPLRNAETNQECRSNLEYLENTLQGALLLEQVGNSLAPAYTLRQKLLMGSVNEPDKDRLIGEALMALNQAPMRELTAVYGRRIRSQGDRGILSSINQKL